jgi:hypothetical protein
MKKQMKKFTVVFSFITFVFLGMAQAKDDKEPSQTGNKQTASNDYKTQVASILSKYNASSLTAEDAKAINNAFRNAGIHRGPEQKEAIEAAGFDPQKISSLDPPPDKNDNRKQCQRKKMEQ